MSTPDAENSHDSQHTTSGLRRPHVVAPASSVPATPLDKESTVSAAPPTPTSAMPPSPLSSSTPIPSSMSAASFASMQSTTETRLPAVSTARPIPASTPTPSPVPLNPSLLPARPTQVVYPPPLKLPSIGPNVPRTSLPPGPSLLNDNAENMPFEHAIDFATQSWDLATGGLKTMTAKRELPTRLDRKSSDLPADESLDRSARNYTFALIIMACIILMLIGSGVVIFVLLQQ